MVFSSVSFLFLFLPITYLLYLLCPGIKLKNLLLTVASLVFYAWGEPIYVFLILISVFINWILGLLLGKEKTNKKLWTILAVALNIGMLFVYKYAGFFVTTVNLIPGLNFAVPQIRLPIGISFFTFQVLSYVLDVARGGQQSQKSYLKLLLYVSLFPQLIAGPIVKYHDVAEQIDCRSINVDSVSKGIRRFIVGLSKKVLIANTMAVIADAIFALTFTRLNVFSAWLGAICYLFQIYFDFSGYSDMAIGLGHMFGFTFKENFNYPLTATSIKDFWRRWHTSLSTWFKEYLYIPLGGNRKGESRTYINQFIVFLATGLWHGANFTFVLWGLLHGLFLVMETKGIIKPEKLKFNWLKGIYTMLVVTVLFVIFRADNITYALGYIKQMFFGFNFSTEYNAIALQYLSAYVITIIAFAFVCSFDIVKRVETKLEKGAFVLKKETVYGFSYVVSMLLLVANVIVIATNAYNPFIYFRF